MYSIQPSRAFLIGLLAAASMVRSSPTLYRRQSPQVSLPSVDNFLLPNIRADPPQTREYTLVVSELNGAPDGYERPMLVVNGTYPGPTIHANQGDTMQITVVNQLQYNSTSIHWHGLYQNSTPFYDGTHGISQCAIPAGQSVTYTFQFGEFSGTTWYHAHYSTQYTDGIVGALVVNPLNPPTQEPQQTTWDFDAVMIWQDWYHELSSGLLAAYLSPNGVDGQDVGDEPVPDSATINGLGQWGGGGAYYNFTFEANATYRLRLIHAGNLADFQFSVDDHPLTVIAADSTDVDPIVVSSVNLTIGQRYDVLLHTNQTGGPWWVRAPMGTDMFTYTQPNQVTDQRAVLRYGSSSSVTSLPSTGQGEATLPVVTDLNPSDLLPADALNAPLPTKVYTVAANFYNLGPGGSQLAYMNNTSWQPLVGNSTLSLLQSPAAQSNMTSFLPEGPSVLYSDQLIVTHHEIEVVDLIVNNLDNGAHPFHLHGHVPWIMASGAQNAGNFTGSTSTLDTTNPMRRDVVLIQGNSYVVLRFVTDNPGAWTFHCHIGWHMSAGLLMQFVSLPEKAAALGFPQTMQEQCNVKQGQGV